MFSRMIVSRKLTKSIRNYGACRIADGEGEIGIAPKGDKDFSRLVCSTFEESMTFLVR